jgi:hypothetical protein
VPEFLLSGLFKIVISVAELMVEYLDPRVVLMPKYFVR